MFFRLRPASLTRRSATVSDGAAVCAGGSSRGRRCFRGVCIGAAIIPLSLWAGAALAATYTVTGLSDVAGTCSGTSPNFSCTTLRAAILAANLTTTVDDTIVFSGSGTVNVTAPGLPAITDTVVINGGGDIVLNGGGGSFVGLSFSATAANSQLLNIGVTNFAQPAVTASGVTNMVISGNDISSPGTGFDAIRCLDSDNCTVTNNTITNGNYGISIYNTGSIAGYNATVSGNVIRGSNFGIGLASVSNVTVSSNDISGSRLAGIRLIPQFGGAGGFTQNNTISNNTISANLGAGIVMDGGNFAVATQVAANRIENNTISNNGGAGITMAGTALGSVVQNTITANTITGNTGAGVQATGATAGNNAIVANTNLSGNNAGSGPGVGLGIDLGANGVTPNDAGDADTGPNQLQNFPVLAGIVGSTVHFTLDTAANANGYRIDFYNNPGGLDPTGFGEAQVWLGSCSVASPSATIPSSCTIAGVAPATLRMTATRCQNAGCAETATTSFGATSELSGPTSVDLRISKTNTPASGASDLAGDTLNRGQSTTYSIVVTNAGTSSVIAAVLRDPAASRTGLTCTTPPVCSGAACPVSPISLAALDAGIALGTLVAGASVTVTLSCTVN